MLVGLAIAELGCNSVCDQASLRGVAEAFEARSFERREQGFEALGQACPTLPPTLARSLRAEFDGTPADLRQRLYEDRPHDPAWRELFDRTCPSAPPARDPVAPHEANEPNARVVRESCQLDRYGLLAPDDVFVERDVVSFMLYEWLVAGRVDRPMARDVVWPLISASAPTEQLDAMCLRESLACERVLERRGLELARSTSDWPTRGDTAVFITATELSVEQTPVLTLAAGRPAALVQHVAPALHEVLMTHAAQGRMHPQREDGTQWQPRVTLVADRATPFATIAATIFTATKAGLADTELVVSEAIAGSELHAIPLHRPHAVREQDRRERPLQLTFIVHRDVVEVRSEGMGPKTYPRVAACTPSPAGCHDLPAIAAFTKQLKALFPHETEAMVRVHGDVPMQTLVSLLDTIRGEGCVLRGSLDGEYVPEECQFFQPIVDAEPALLFPPPTADPP